MATKATTVGTSGMRQPNLEALLDSRGIAWSFDEAYPIEKITQDEGVQVRLSTELARPADVRRYTTQMRAGVIFPGIVLTEDGNVGDGNTRLAAAKKCGWETIPAYTLFNVSDDALRLLALELNQKNGQAMSAHALRRQVELYNAAHPEAPLQPKVWAARTGVPEAKIRDWTNLGEFTKRAIRGEFTEEQLAPITDTAKLTLYSLSSDALFNETVSVALKAGLNSEAVRALVNDVKAAAKASEHAALEVLAERCKTDFADAIASGGAVAPRPNAWRQHKMHVKYLASNVTDPMAVLSVPADERDDVIAMLKEAARVANAMRTILEELDDTKAAA